MSFCRRCGTKIPEGARFCPKCGTEVRILTGSKQNTEQQTKSPESADDKQQKMADAERLAEFIQELQKGNRQHFSELYRMTSQIVKYNILANGVSQNDVEDIMQEVYVKVVNEAASLQNPMQAFGWIKRIAVNQAIDYTRRASTIHEQLMPESKTEDDGSEENDLMDLQNIDAFLASPMEIPEDYADHKETQRLMRDIINSLPPNQLSAITDHYYDDIPIKDIAEMMQKSEDSVKMDLYRGRKAIETKVNELAEKYDTRLIAVPAGIFFGSVMISLASGLDTHAAEAGVAQAVRRTVHTSIAENAGSNVSAGATETVHGTDKISTAVNTGKTGKAVAALNTGAKAVSGAKAAGTAAGWAGLSHGIKAVIIAGVFGVSAASTVGMAAVTGHLPMRQEEQQQEPQQKESPQTEKPQASPKTPEKTPLEKAKEEASQKTAEDAYNEFMRTDPAITSVSNTEYAEVNVDGYSYGPLLLISRTRDDDDAEENAFAAYFYNNGDYGDDTVGQVVRISKEDDSAFDQVDFGTDGAGVRNALIEAFPDLNAFNYAEGTSPLDYDSSAKELVFTDGDAGMYWYKFGIGADGTGSFKLDRAMVVHYRDGYMFDLWSADGTDQHINDYGPYTQGLAKPTWQPIPKN